MLLFLCHLGIGGNRDGRRCKGRTCKARSKAKCGCGKDEFMDIGDGQDIDLDDIPGIAKADEEPEDYEPMGYEMDT